MQATRLGSRAFTVSVAVGLCLAVPSSATAATQLGQLTPPATITFPCDPAESTVQTFVEDGNPYTVPAGGGVITSWRHLAGTADVGSGRLQVWRGNLMGTTFMLVGRSDVHGFSAGVTHSFQTRVPVSAGDLLGFRATNKATCGFDAPGMGTSDDVYRSAFGTPDSNPGDVLMFPAGQMDRRLNVSATLEPDADADGFGDETQDQCLGEAGTENGCAPDASPPGAAITKGPKDKTRKKTATFEFAGIEARVISGFQCKLDAEQFRACSSPVTYKVKKGKHTFQVQAIDQAGNVGAPATDSWKVKKKRKN
jgi:hypothetical protein